MKNYEAMSDNELNTMVADLRGGYAGNVHGSESKVKVSDPDSGGLFYMEVDYCNNPSDAWPIILEYQISIAKYEWIEKWDAHGGGVCVDYDHCIISNSDCSYSNKNPLRAAMVVFLMMQESKS